MLCNERTSCNNFFEVLVEVPSSGSSSSSTGVGWTKKIRSQNKNKVPAGKHQFERANKWDRTVKNQTLSSTS